jgi:hypothetical protein
VEEPVNQKIKHLPRPGFQRGAPEDDSQLLSRAFFLMTSPIWPLQNGGVPTARAPRGQHPHCSGRGPWRVPAFWRPRFVNPGAGQPPFV